VVRDLVRDKLELSFEDMGEKQVKNIARPVRVHRVVLGESPPAGSAQATEELTKPSLALPDKPSIAVLPFQNMSGDPEQEYFADGVQENARRNCISGHSTFWVKRLSTIRVSGPPSAQLHFAITCSMSLAGQPMRAKTVAREWISPVARSGSLVTTQKFSAMLPGCSAISATTLPPQSH
jgi:hypothetical protein